jgi:hypothetical protein
MFLSRLFYTFQRLKKKKQQHFVVKRISEVGALAIDGNLSLPNLRDGNMATSNT